MILERVATLQEIETHWSLDDVADANLALNAIAEAKQRAEESRGRH